MSRKRAPKAKQSLPAPRLAIQGFREDMAVLVSSFLEADSFRFEHFVSAWEKMNFGYVFSGTQNVYGETSEVNEFAIKCFREAVSLCAPTNQSPNRVAGVYLLYCLYTIRPMYCHSRVRIHPTSEFLPLARFVQNLQDHGNYDVVFVFLELLEQHAFVFTVTPLEMGYHTQWSKPFRDDASAIHTYVPEIPALLAGTEYTEMLDQDKAYTAAKAELVQQMSDCPQFNHEQLQYTSSEFKGKLDNIVQDFGKCIANLSGQVVCGADISQNPDHAVADKSAAETESAQLESVGQRRQRLRQQQAKRPVKRRYESS